MQCEYTIALKKYIMAANKKTVTVRYYHRGSVYLLKNEEKKNPNSSSIELGYLMLNMFEKTKCKAIAKGHGSIFMDTGSVTLEQQADGVIIIAIRSGLSGKNEHSISSTFEITSHSVLYGLCEKVEMLKKYRGEPSIFEEKWLSGENPNSSMELDYSCIDVLLRNEKKLSLMDILEQSGFLSMLPEQEVNMR